MSAAENEMVPAGWRIAKLGDVCNTTSGGTPSRRNKDYFKGEIPWLKSGELSDGLVRDIEEAITQEAIDNSSAKLFPAGTLLIALYGATVGKLGILQSDAATNQAVCAIFPEDELDQKYLFWFLRYARSDLLNQAIGGAQTNISQGILRNLPVPIAPKEQQPRIVAEIEKQFSRLDEAVASLKRVKANLKRYKAAVLKAAVEGKLTEEWRKQNPDVEPASKLLERILVERRTKWEEAELAKMKAKGKEPKNDKWKEKYKEASTLELPGMPAGWASCASDEVFSFVTSGSRGWAKYYSEEGSMFLRMGNLDHDTIDLDLSDIQRVQPPENGEGTRTKVQSNDLLISITADVGMLGIVPEEFGEAYINQHVALARPVRNVNAKYIAWYFVSRAAKNQLRALQKGATKVGLGLDDIRAIAIALPSIEEQSEIVAAVDVVLSRIDSIEAVTILQEQRINAARSAVLKRAFSTVPAE